MLSTKRFTSSIHFWGVLGLSCTVAELCLFAFTKLTIMDKVFIGGLGIIATFLLFRYTLYKLPQLIPANKPLAMLYLFGSMLGPVAGALALVSMVPGFSGGYS